MRIGRRRALRRRLPGCPFRTATACARTWARAPPRWLRSLAVFRGVRYWLRVEFRVTRRLRGFGNLQRRADDHTCRLGRVRGSGIGVFGRPLYRGADKRRPRAERGKRLTDGCSSLLTAPPPPATAATSALATFGPCRGGRDRGRAALSGNGGAAPIVAFRRFRRRRGGAEAHLV